MVENFTAHITPFGLDRNTFVYLPDDWQSSGRRYLVVYMFDGHNLFFDSTATYGTCWGLKEYMDAHPQAIIVAPECNHEGNARLAEYSPYDFVWQEYDIKGRGKAYMDWMVQELKPLIDAKYPTLPDRESTAIGGSSMGGLMSLYAVTAFNDVYSRAACLSPSIWFATRSLDRLIRDAQFAPDTVIYMDYGSREMAHHDNMRKQYAAVTSRLLEKQVLLTSRIVPNGDHCEACWEEQIPFFMHILFYNRE
jgi:predicted alpha/beta superfamily hydrolase